MKWRFMRFLLPAMLALVVADAPALAQRAAKQAGPPAAAARRERLERQVTERLAQVVRRELGLDDAGMRRLQQTNQRFEGRRRELVRRERTARAELRKQLAEGKGTNQDRVAALLDELLEVNQSRSRLLGEEQRELADFLSPVQRARYLGIQEQFRRRVEEVVRGREGAGGAAGAPGRRPVPRR